MSADSVALTLARFTPADREQWLAAAANVLDKQEQARLAAITDPDGRTRHALGRALIRLAGAATAGLAPGRVQVTVSAAGKPELEGLGVSVAHSGRLVAIASCSGSALGVDVEAVGTDSATTRRLVERRFAASEAATARGLSDEPLRQWFARAWTIKEAVGKALGVGMIPALAGAVVNDAADALVSVWSGPPAERWTLHQLRAAGDEHWIAVALPAPGVALGAVTELTLSAFARACA